MAMNVRTDEDDDSAISDINVIPLADTMLVMLIIFLIAVPVVLQSIPVQLPSVRYEPTQTKPENVNLSVRAGPDGECEVYWNITRVDSEELLDRGVEALENLIEEVGGIENVTEDNMPEAHIRGDVDTPYRCIGGTVFTMQRAGFARVGFISEPEPSAVTTRL